MIIKNICGNCKYVKITPWSFRCKRRSPVTKDGAPIFPIVDEDCWCGEYEYSSESQKQYDDFKKITNEEFDSFTGKKI